MVNGNEQPLNHVNKTLFFGFLVMFLIVIYLNIHFYFHLKGVHEYYITEQMGEINNRTYYYNADSKTFKDVVDGCYNTAGFNSLQERYTCIVYTISQNFTYKTRADATKITIEELLYDGADCEKWALFYEDLAIYYNYSYKPILVKTDDNSYHRFTIVYDDTGYCKIDMTNINCFKYGENSNTNILSSLFKL